MVSFVEDVSKAGSTEPSWIRLRVLTPVDSSVKAARQHCTAMDSALITFTLCLPLLCPVVRHFEVRQGPLLFSWELPRTPPVFGPFRGKTTFTFCHGTPVCRTGVLNSSSKTLERGTGLEPATSTLGKLRSAD